MHHEIRRMRIDELVPAAYNPRTISDQAMRGLEASIREFGVVQPVILNSRTGVIVGGHQRVKAMQSQGIVETDVVVVDLSEEREKALNVALNSPHIAGEFTRAVSALLAELESADSDLYAALRFGELANEFSPTESVEEDDCIPEEPEAPVTNPGDVWELGPHRLVCGDSTDAESYRSVLRGDQVALLVTSPPYNQNLNTQHKTTGRGVEGMKNWKKKLSRISYADTLEEADYQQQQAGLLGLWHEVVADGASIFYNHKNRYREKRVVTPLQWILDSPLALRQEIIWSRPGSMMFTPNMFMSTDERIYWLYKGDDFYFDTDAEIRGWTTVWQIAPKGHPDHPAPFPIEIPIRCVRACSRVGDIVLDPFMGSGTTLMAAESVGRRARGIELSPSFCDVIVERWQNATGGKAVRE